jgi:hypothetical protein
MTPLPLIAKACAISIEELLSSGQFTTRRGAIHLASLYRKFGMAKFMFSGDIYDVKSSLSKASQAYLAYLLNSHTVGEGRISDLDPLYDAIISGDSSAVKGIFRVTQNLPNHRAEYPEDVAFAKIIQCIACDEGNTSDEVIRRHLNEWKSISGGGENRFNLCQALLDRSQKEIQVALISLLDERLKDVRQRQKDESGDPDERATTDRINLEVVALVILSKSRLGLDLHIQHRQLPDDIFLESKVPLPPPDAWKNIDSYRSLT